MANAADRKDGQKLKSGVSSITSVVASRSTTNTGQSRILFLGNGFPNFWFKKFHRKRQKKGRGK